MLTGRNSYWGRHEDSDDDELDTFAAATTTTPKKAPGPPRAVPKNSPIPKPSPTKTSPTTMRTARNEKPTSVPPDRVKAFARVLDPTVPVDQVQNIPRQPILEKRKRVPATANRVDDPLRCSTCGKVFPTAHGCSLHAARYCNAATPSVADAKKEVPKKSAKTIRMEELIEKKAADEAVDGADGKNDEFFDKKRKDAKNGQVSARNDVKKRRRTSVKAISTRMMETTLRKSNGSVRRSPNKVN